jgi:hypothetical protein
LTWPLLLATVSSFILGWAAGVWQCSRRRECPRYAAYALEKWKRDVEKQVQARSPRPAAGGEGDA